MILGVPPQVASIPAAVIAAAEKFGISIREVHVPVLP